MGRRAEAVHEGRDVWGGAYSQMSLGNLAARSVLIDATEGWSAGEKLPSPGSDLLVSVRTRLECSNSSAKLRVWFGTTPASHLVTKRTSWDDSSGVRRSPSCRPGRPNGDPKVLWAAR